LPLISGSDDVRIRHALAAAFAAANKKPEAKQQLATALALWCRQSPPFIGDCYEANLLLRTLDGSADHEVTNSDRALYGFSVVTNPDKESIGQLNAFDLLRGHSPGPISFVANSFAASSPSERYDAPLAVR